MVGIFLTISLYSERFSRSHIRSFGCRSASSTDPSPPPPPPPPQGPSHLNECEAVWESVKHRCFFFFRRPTFLYALIYIMRETSGYEAGCSWFIEVWEHTNNATKSFARQGTRENSYLYILSCFMQPDRGSV